MRLRRSSMKKFFTLTIGLLSLSALASQNESQQHTSKAEKVLAPVEKVWIPQGYDDNDNIQIIVHGKFPNACYRVGHITHKLHKDTKEIELFVSAYKHESEFCAEMVTPYILETSIGLLNPGEYTVKLAQNYSMRTQFNVIHSQSNYPDDYLYSQIKGAYLDNAPRGQQNLTLVGEHPRLFTGCMKIKEVKTYKDPKDILVVLPIAEILPEEDCDNVSPYFKISHPISAPLEGEGLIHIRSINGSATNIYVN